MFQYKTLTSPTAPRDQGGTGGDSPGWAIIPFLEHNQYLWLLYATEATLSFDSLGFDSLRLSGPKGSRGGGGRGVAQDGLSYPSGGTTNTCGCSMPRKLR